MCGGSGVMVYGGVSDQSHVGPADTHSRYDTVVSPLKLTHPHPGLVGCSPHRMSPSSILTPSPVETPWWPVWACCPGFCHNGKKKMDGSAEMCYTYTLILLQRPCGTLFGINGAIRENHLLVSLQTPNGREAIYTKECQKIRNGQNGVKGHRSRYDLSRSDVCLI